MTHKRVLILDFGSQYTMLIARRIRELNVYSEIRRPDENFAFESGLLGFVLSGGPMSVYDAEAPKLREEVLKSGLPILGICYGHQLLAYRLGGEVKRAKKKEYGLASFRILEENVLFRGFPPLIRVWMSHGDEVTKLPPGAKHLGETPGAKYAAFSLEDKKIYGLQFHPEVSHTERGGEILKNFLYEVLGAQGDWIISSWVEETIEWIERKTRGKGVLLALSGGVDSSVLAELLHRAVGDRLYAIFVDTGLLKEGERERIERAFSHLKNLIIIDARDRFFKALKEIIDPEEKRRIVGGLFGDIFKEEAMKLRGDIEFLAQGTLYPDVIESGRGVGPAAVIKTHHNVGGLPELPFELIEPFRELFKDEVREIGRILSLPDEIIMRHPFPGPGFAVRILGEVTEERVEILRRADSIIEEEVKKEGWYGKLWQIFPVLITQWSVGVKGDRRTYEYVIAIRGVVSVDGMTADWARLPHEFLDRMARRIVGEVEGINRVVYDITSKPPATIEWE